MYAKLYIYLIFLPEFLYFFPFHSPIIYSSFHPNLGAYVIYRWPHESVTAFVYNRTKRMLDGVFCASVGKVGTKLKYFKIPDHVVGQVRLLGDLFMVQSLGCESDLVFSLVVLTVYWPLLSWLCKSAIL